MYKVEAIIRPRCRVRLHSRRPKTTTSATEFENHKNFSLNDRFESVDPPMDTVGDDSDSDDGNNGDFEEVEPFIPVAHGRSTNSSRSASSISSGSLSPPTPITPTSNVFEPLAADFIVPVAQKSWIFDDILRGEVTARLRPSRSQGESVGRSTRPERNSAT